MKWVAFGGGVAAAIVMSCCGSPGHAGVNVLPESARTVEAGRAVEVLVPQGEIKSNFKKYTSVMGAVTLGMAGVLVDTAVETAVNSERSNKADFQDEPLRLALTGYDLDALALETTRAALAAVPWFQPTSFTFDRDTSVSGKSGVLDASPTGQVAFVEYAYDLLPSGAQIRVVMRIQIANTAIPKDAGPNDRLSRSHLLYAQTITSVVTLPSATKDVNENVGQWSFHKGRLARKALATAFANIGALLPRALDLTDADVAAMTKPDQKTLSIDGYHGRVQEQSDPGTLLFNGGFVHIQPVDE
jgi:hypothetical protein